MNNKNNERIKKNLFINKLEQGLNIALVFDAGNSVYKTIRAELLTLAQQKKYLFRCTGPNAAIAAIKFNWIV